MRRKKLRKRQKSLEEEIDKKGEKKKGRKRQKRTPIDNLLGLARRASKSSS